MAISDDGTPVPLVTLLCLRVLRIMPGTSPFIAAMRIAAQS